MHFPLTSRNNHTTKINYDLFHRVKTEAFKLIQDCQLLGIQWRQGYLQCVGDLVGRTGKCGDGQRGEIYLLIMRSASKMGMSACEIKLPYFFIQDVFAFINGMIEVNSGQYQQNHSSQIYTHRFRPSPSILIPQDGKTRLKDLLIIDRYDKLLLSMLTELEEKQRLKTSKISKHLNNFLLSTFKYAQRFLIIDQSRQYKQNIEAIMRLWVGKKKKEKECSKSLGHNFIIIDKDKAVLQSPMPLRHRSLHRQLLKRKPTVVMRLQSKESSQEDQQKSQSSIQRINSKPKRCSRRGSTLSIFSKRSSNNIVTSMNYAPQKPPTRTSASLIKQSSQNQGKLQRRSRFQMISKLQQQSLKREINAMKKSSYKESQQPQIRIRNLSRMCSYKQQGWRGDIFFRQFYLFAQEGGSVNIFVVQQQRRSQFSFVNQESLRLRLRHIDYKCSVVLDPELTTDDEDIVEAICQQFIGEHVSMVREGSELKLKIRKQQAYSPINLFQVKEGNQERLMSFVRKINTYFVHISRYSKTELGRCHGQSIKKQLLSSNQLLPITLTLTSKLLNCQMTISFQEEVQKINYGNVINYIQNQEQIPDLSLTKSYKVINQYCNLREGDEVMMKVTWWGGWVKVITDNGKKKKGRRGNQSRMSRGMGGQEILPSKKLRKTAHNKSSIKLYQQCQELQVLYLQNEAMRKSRLSSRKDMILSEKKLKIVVEQSSNKTRKERALARKTKSIVQTVLTEKGYKLIKKSVIENVGGFVFNQQEGYLERNPQVVRIWKGKDRMGKNYMLPKTTMTIRGQKDSKVSNTKLITFVKPIQSQSINMGYLVSTIKILTNSPNHSIYVESYSQKMQKYFIFIINAQLFQQLTLVNTTNFKQKPFMTEREHMMSKKKEKRTSVNEVMVRQRVKTVDSPIKQTLVRATKINRECSLPIREDSEDKGSRFKESKTIRQPKKNQHSAKLVKTANGLSSHGNKTHFNLIAKRQISSHIKTKMVKYTSFVWGQHGLQMVIHTHSKQNLVFEGRQIALKNIHESKDNPQVSTADQLILIKYQENNLGNLAFFPLEALNKISLQHIFIKNDNSLYSRYHSVLSLNIMPYETKIQHFYRNNNNFFQTKDSNRLPQIIPRMKTTLSKLSTRQDHKRFKYVDVLNFAKQCALPFSFIESKRRKHTRKTFVVPNRYKYLYIEQHMLHIHLQLDGIMITTLRGEIILNFAFQRLRSYFPEITRLNAHQQKQILLKRILVDQDIIRLCMTDVI